MRFKHTLLSLLLSFSCFAQVDLHIPNAGNAATREWVKVYLDEWLTRVPPPVINPPADTASGLPACTSGPIINSVSNVTKTSLKASLSFTGVTSLNWAIYKSSAPGLILKSGNISPLNGTNNINWVGDLVPGEHVLKVYGVNCTGGSTSNFILSSTPTPLPCTAGPVILNLFNATRTGLIFEWSGLNVPEIVWTIKQGATTIRSGSFVTSGAQTINISYTQLGFGTYDLQLNGLTCPTQTAARSFTLIDNTPTPTTARAFYLNLTGYGWDQEDPTGIRVDNRNMIDAFVNMNYQGTNFKGIQGLRINIKWYEYEPSEGNFQDSRLLAILNWCKSRGIKLSVALIPWRREGDNMIPNGHKSTLINDRIWYAEGSLQDLTTYKTYQPSTQSPIGREKFRRVARHMAQTLNQFPNDVDYISTATALTEEYQLIRDESPMLMTGYSQIDKEAWNTFAGGLPVPYPASYSDVSSIESMMSTSNGRKWYEFQTKGLKDFHAEFVAGVKEGGLRACGMYAGAGAPSAVYDFTYKLNEIYSAGQPNQPNIIYSSEGDAGSQGSKLMATDLNMGTFPASNYAIEFDPEDIAANQVHNPPYGIDLNGNLLYQYASSFFRRGGNIVHFAMSFAPNKLHQIYEAMFNLRNQFIDTNSGMTGIDQGTPFNFPITNYTGMQGYRGQWSANGGGLNKQVKFTLQ
ncbi:hypothetical protein [Dyadobacter bucti]|uniref:hypothetical protein n=1 Tax=Dyadobacter bucti TaxID=2572203 RepID=UPI0011090C79|nr:hypothetical protein [Dyadobacter bucti]